MVKLMEGDNRGVPLSYLHLVSLINSIHAIVWELDAATFEFNFVSDFAQTLLGYPIDDWYGDPKFWLNHIHPEDREEAYEYCVAQTKEKKRSFF